MRNIESIYQLISLNSKKNFFIPKSLCTFSEKVYRFIYAKKFRKVLNALMTELFFTENDFFAFGKTTHNIPEMFPSSVFFLDYTNPRLPPFNTDRPFAINFNS